MGAGGEQLHPSGGGTGSGGDRLQVNQEQQEAAGEQPAVSASLEPEVKAEEAPASGLARFSLFPTVEEQVEAIAEAQAEEKRQTEIDASSIHRVSDAVADRILTSGGNRRHSIERIVAFFQKDPSAKDAAAFLEKEYGVGGKGLTVARAKYSMWFDERGVHICPGNNTYGTIFTHLPWSAVAVRISQLLKDGMFASQEKIDMARENELDSLANRLADLRMEFSDAAKEKDYLHTVSEAYQGSRSEESVLRIKELLREPESRRHVLSELRAFSSFYVTDRSLLEHRPTISLPALTRQIADLDKPVTEFKAVDGFAPAKATFITENEIDHFLANGPHVQDGKIRIYSYFMQGHDAKECAAFLRRECGDAGHSSEGLMTWSDAKGIKFTRSDEVSGVDGYDTVHLNWNQAQKRIRDLIEKDRYLTSKERESLPEHDKNHLAKMIYHFFSHVPDCQHRPFADGADAAEAATQIRPLLETPEVASKLFDTMMSDFAAVSPDAEGYTGMMFAMRDMGAFVRGDSPLFSPLPESALQAEREVKERSREKSQSTQKAVVPDVPGEASGDLASVARALASKRKPEAEAQGDGQFSLFSSGQAAEAEPQEQREITDADLDHFLIEDLGDPERRQRLYALFTEGWSDAIIVRKLEQEYSRSRRGNVEGGFCTLADGTRGYAYFAKELRISPRPEGKMRHVSFEEMAQHIHQLIQENRYLSPEELEQYQKDHAAPEAEAPKAEPEKKYSLGYGFFGNGLTVWNSMEMEDGDYKTIAHIAPDRTVTFYADDLPEEIKREIQHAAAASDARISATQDAPVFSTPPQVLEQEQESSRSPWWDEYTAIKESHPNHLVLYQIGDFFELYGEDAKNAADVLGLTLTTRPIGGVGRVEMCGLPAHALEQNVEKLRGQYDVAISTVDEKTGAYQTRTMAALMTGAEPEKRAVEQSESPAPAGEAAAVVQNPNYEITVTSAEALILARPMSQAGITPERTVQENGDVTFSVAEAEKDTLERLITTIRNDISKAAAAVSRPKKARRTRPEINYSTFAKLFPEIISGEYRSMRLQAGPSYMPLHVQWIADDVVALGHTFRQNGDTMNDPEMTFRVDREKGTLEALTFQQDGGVPIYQQVYPEPGKWIPKLRNDLNNFAAKWMKNITAQKFIRERAVAVKDGEDVEVFFSPEGTPIAAYDILMREADAITAQLLNDESYTNARMNSDEQNSRDECYIAINRIAVSMLKTNPQFYHAYFDTLAAVHQFRDYLFETTYQQNLAAEQPPVSAVTLYREALALLAGAVRGSSFYDYLRDRETDYDSARNELDAEITAMMEEIKEQNPALHEAYHTLPKFREWLIEDILEQTYQDVITDSRDAVQRYAGTPDAPAWIQEAPAQLEANTEIPPAPEAVQEPTGAGAPENVEMVWHTSGGKEYCAGDTVEYFVDGKAYQIILDSIGGDYVYYTFPDLAQAPVEMFRDKFESYLDDGSFTVVPRTREVSQENPALDHSEAEDSGDTAAAEPNLTPNVEEYLNLKAQYPDKLVGVQVGDYMLFYGKDAEEAAFALNRDVLTQEIPGLGETSVTGCNGAWQAVLKKLLEHGKSVVLARPDPQRGPDAPYEIIKERDISEYIPLGKELTIDGRRMKVDRIDYANGKVSLLDMEMAEKYRYPVFREEPVAFVREYVEEAERREFEQTARVEEIAEAEPLPEQVPSGDIPVGTVLTVNGHRMKIDSVDTARDEVMLLDLDARGGPPMFSVKSGATVRGLLADAPAADKPVPPESQDHNEADELEEAKRLIEDFCDAEYGGGVDFSDLEHIGIAYTTTENEQHEIQVEANLLDFSVTQTLDGQLIEQRRYKTLRELIDNELSVLDFDDLIHLEGEPEQLLATALKAPHKPEPAPEPEQVEIDGGRIAEPPAPKTPMTSKVVGRVNAGAFDVVFEELHVGPELHNFHIANEDLGAGGQKTKYQNNVAAIRTLKQIEAEGRLATPEEQEILSRYVGWGSLAPAFDEHNKAWAKEFAELQSLLTPEEYAATRATTLNAHYTSPRVIKAIYDAVERMGFQPGNILEPSCGIGNFFGLLPEALSGANLYGVELDSLTGRIARQLYQKAHITVDGFENTDHPDDFFDLAVGNVPFGAYPVHDRRYDRMNLQIHDYFLMKTLDKLRPGGIMAVITSKGTMDKKNSKVREALAQKANLLGAIRLPNNAFKANAGTEVTSDILFFQKRATVPEKLPEWVESGLTADGVPLNQYYFQHPEMVLGTMTLGKSMYGNDTETACYPIEGADLAEQLAGAISHIAPPDQELLEMDAPEQEDGKTVESIPADPNVRNFSYTMSKGKIYFRENSRMAPAELGKKPTERVKGMIAIRDSARKLIDLQLKGAADAEIKAEQANLNRLYDAYTKKYGILNSPGNRLAFNQDSSYPLLCSLEVLDDEGNFKHKADMFTKRTIQHHEVVTSVDTAVEALAVSIGERACVDLGFMASLMGDRSPAGSGDKIPQIVEDLKGIIFKDPATGPFDIEAGGTDWYKGWQTADEYLSGDVRGKLAKARAAAGEHPEFAVNVEALEQVQPKDLTAAEISVRIGAPWVKPAYYRQFLFELLQTPEHLQNGKIDVLYNKITGEWSVKGKSEDKRDNARLRATYGTKRRSAYVIFENLLNQRDTRVYDEDAEGKRTINPKHTAVAQQKAEALDQAFRDWIFKDPERRADLCATYNRLFNSKRPREYNGDHITFAGMNPEYKLEPHQRNAVARMLYGGNSLLAHCVGAGKTYEMTAAAMESKRLGLCQKSLFVVPNHLTEQWGSDFLTLYPGAKVLVATKKDFKPKNRKKFCARIATGDYDAVIIGHSQFEMIPLSPERQAKVIEDQISEIMDAIAEAKAQKEENWTIKQMEGTRKDLEAKLKKLTDKKKDDTVTFEELGIDRLFVDEAHYYKNLFLHTKMRNVAGIAQTEAQKSSDMFGKCRYLDELTGGRG
ncbi:MAG: N-6 DNA methylase, partial [Oscillospiraceae bacterium]|nr:N-6 DNA methylase [Oscillospiraceae bacterium]